MSILNAWHNLKNFRNNCSIDGPNLHYQPFNRVSSYLILLKFFGDTKMNVFSFQYNIFANFKNHFHNQTL